MSSTSQYSSNRVSDNRVGQHHYIGSDASDGPRQQPPTLATVQRCTLALTVHRAAVLVLRTHCAKSRRRRDTQASLH